MDRNSQPTIRITILLLGLNGAGIQRMRFNLAAEFHSRGYLVDIAAKDSSGVLHDKVPKGVGLSQLGSGAITSYALALYRYFKRSEASYILSSYEDLSVLALFLNLVLNRKHRIIVSTHNSLSAVRMEGGIARRIKSRLVFFLIRLLYRQAHSLVAVSKGVAIDMARVIGSSNIVNVIYNPVIGPDFFSQVQAKSDLLGNLGLGSSRLVGFFGRFHPQKRLDVLLDAFRVVSSQEECVLLLVGEGEEYEDVKHRIHEADLLEKVVIVDFQKNPYSLIKRCSMVVLSSDYEGLGNVLVEALACGVQVVSTDCPYGPSEILENGRYGQLVEVGKPDQLAGAILKVLRGQHFVDREDLISRGLEFSASAAANEYLKAMGLPLHLASQGSE